MIDRSLSGSGRPADFPEAFVLLRGNEAILGGGNPEWLEHGFGVSQDWILSSQPGSLTNFMCLSTSRRPYFLYL